MDNPKPTDLERVLFEIERFKPVATALTQEACEGDFIIAVLINHLKIKLGGKSC